MRYLTVWTLIVLIVAACSRKAEVASESAESEKTAWVRILPNDEKLRYARDGLIPPTSLLTFDLQAGKFRIEIVEGKMHNDAGGESTGAPPGGETLTPSMPDHVVTGTVKLNSA